MTTEVRPDLRALVDRLAELADAWLALLPTSAAARERATQLCGHVRGHLAVRAATLDAPILVLLLGPTGAGKSSLFNTIAGRVASQTGVLRPTTRTAVVLAPPGDLATLRAGALAGIAADRVDAVADPGVPPGLAVVDAPDVDSVEHANRELADRLVEAADLCVFVTTATRYADRVPWTVLERVRARGLPLTVVVNRLPTDPSDRGVVLDDVRRLFGSVGFGADLEIVGVEEGGLDPAVDGLDAAAIAPIRARIEGLRADADARRRLAAEALAGALAGVGPLVARVGDDVAHEGIEVAALRRMAATAYDRELGELRDDVRHGRFLRDEALRHWQQYVGADDITRWFSRGIGAIRGAITAIVRPTRAPVAEVRDATTDDLTAAAHRHAADAARRTAAAWADEPRVAAAAGEQPELWEASEGFDVRMRERIEDWATSIAADIAANGANKRLVARGASIGVNALGVGVMLATFIHTAGLTGTEVGVAAATAFLNQKLLGALFGEAAMVELVDRARARLDVALVEAFGEERARFDALLPSQDALLALERGFRSVGEDLARTASVTSEPPDPAPPSTPAP
jgi:energy-coupling factor transporter ATP-binding protein EcfA2